MSSQNIIKRVFEPTALVGQVSARKYGTTGSFFPIGNVLKLELTHAESEETQPNMTRRGGGAYASLRRVTAAQIEMQLADSNVTNVARACQAAVHGVESGSVAAEQHTVQLGGKLRTAHMDITNVRVYKGAAPGTATVTDEEHLDVDKGDLITLENSDVSNVVVKTGADLVSATELTAAGNYTVVNGGSQIQVAADAPGVTNGQAFWVSYQHPTGDLVAAAGNYEVDTASVYVYPEASDLDEDDTVFLAYDYGSYAVIEALTAEAAELELMFEGLNETGTKKPSVVDIWRVSQGVASSIALLAEKGFSTLPVKGTLVEDPTKTGEDTSKFYRVRKA